MVGYGTPVDTTQYGAAGVVGVPPIAATATLESLSQAQVEYQQSDDAAPVVDTSVEVLPPSASDDVAHVGPYHI